MTANRLPAAFGLALLAMLPGCTMFGFASKAIEGPPKHYAKYIPVKEPAAVVVEAYQTGSGGGLDPDQIAVFASHELSLHDVVPVVDASRVYDLRARDAKRFRTMTMAEIGRQVGARQVIYVDLEETDVVGPIGSQSLRGTLTARVRVVDAETGATRWPAEHEGGYPVSFQTPYIQEQPGVDIQTVRETLNRAAGDTIAKLFYTWQEAD